MTENSGAARRIVVGLDGSAGGEAALRWAIGYARAVGAEVVAVYALDVPGYFSYPFNATAPIVLDESVRDDMKKRLEEEWCAPLAAAGVRHRAVLADGRPADVLLDVSERENADLVVTGRRGLNTLGELVLGSVSHHLVHGSRRPVVLVPSEPQRAA
jgi:nucleotide-binding universal stress UspA family protein